ncbi:DUF1996 domain-containing protein, partial [Salmonella enterica]|uniref:DUF1996 domain-containing protein n=1 Tax=Salmonella enterica TaxID=28901 RepID=UPI00398C73E8
CAGGAVPATAGQERKWWWGQTHKLGGEGIMMVGKEEQAMVHDILGNTHTDAVSTNQTLRAQPDTTGDNKADSSAYCAPSTKLPDGEIVNPAYQKTYYTSTTVAQYPLHPSPPGLALPAVAHLVAAPEPPITVLC